jgi:hypothetical protein
MTSGERMVWAATFSTMMSGATSTKASMLARASVAAARAARVVEAMRAPSARLELDDNAEAMLADMLGART